MTDFPYHMLDDIQYMEQRMLEAEQKQPLLNTLESLLSQYLERRIDKSIFKNLECSEQ